MILSTELNSRVFSVRSKIEKQENECVNPKEKRE